jgi:hypothetical protein
MCRRTSQLFVIAALAVASIAFSRDAAACSCIGTRPACQAFWDPGAVFVGRVLSIEPSASSGGPSPETRRVRFEIAEPFHGVSEPAVDVFTGSGGGDCGYAFTVGESYLVYAYQSERSPRLSTGICSRTRPLSGAAEDLAYLRTLPQNGALGATITGVVYHRDRIITLPAGATMMAPVASLELVMDCGGAAYRGTTDANGHFVITGVPAGACTPGLAAIGADFLATVNPITIPDPRACADVSLMVGTRKK